MENSGRPFLYGVLWTLAESVVVGLLLAVGVNRVVEITARTHAGVRFLWCLFSGLVWYFPPRRGR